MNIQTYPKCVSQKKLRKREFINSLRWRQSSPSDWKVAQVDSRPTWDF